MAQLIYSTIMSLDGYIADQDGNFDWAAPDEELHTFFNDLTRPVGTYLYGRRMYETMAVWDTLPTHGQPPFIAEFARIWRAADKIVYSRTLASPSTSRTRVERVFDPAAVRQLKASAARDLAVGGPNLAAQTFQAGLVDACHLVVVPVLVGGGTRAFPGSARLALVLEEQRRFARGAVYLHYRSAPAHEERPPMRTGIVIRSETAADAGPITDVTIAAFNTLPISDHTEQFIIVALRAAHALTVSLVAELDGRIVAHIAFSPVAMSDGSPGWYGLGPVSVLPAYQRQGIGTALIQEGLSRLKELGARGCCLVGHPEYYGRFGFQNPEEFVQEGVPPEAFFVMSFDGPIPQGSVEFHEGFKAAG
jgi:putative acetyltransferase